MIDLDIGGHSPFKSVLGWEESVLEVLGRPLLRGQLGPVGGGQGETRQTRGETRDNTHH